MRAPLLATFFTVAAVASAAAAPLAGCNPPEPRTGLNYSADAARAYAAAMEEFNAHNWLEAQQLLREVKRKYAYSRYAPLAELKIADADFEQDKFGEAIRGYKQFVHDHRSMNTEVAYARARIAESQYRQISDSFLRRPARSAIRRDRRSRTGSSARTSTTTRVEGERADLRSARGRHGQARAPRAPGNAFYLARDNFDGTVGRVQYALRNSPPIPRAAAATSHVRHRRGSGVPHRVRLAPEALLLLGETYLKMHRWKDARAAFNAILKRYPEALRGAGAELPELHAERRSLSR